MARAICCLEGGWTTAVREAMVRTVAITERPLLAKFASETAPIQMVFATARMQCRRKASSVARGEVVRIGTGTRGHKSQDRLLRTSRGPAAFERCATVCRCAT